MVNKEFLKSGPFFHFFLSLTYLVSLFGVPPFFLPVGSSVLLPALPPPHTGSFFFSTYSYPSCDSGEFGVPPTVFTLQTELDSVSIPCLRTVHFSFFFLESVVALFPLREFFPPLDFPQAVTGPPFPCLMASPPCFFLLQRAHFLSPLYPPFIPTSIFAPRDCLCSPQQLRDPSFFFILLFFFFWAF